MVVTFHFYEQDVGSVSQVVAHFARFVVYNLSWENYFNTFLSHLDYQDVPYLLITEKLMNIKLPDKCKHLIV